MTFPLSTTRTPAPFETKSSGPPAEDAFFRLATGSVHSRTAPLITRSNVWGWSWLIFSPSNFMVIFAGGSGWLIHLLRKISSGAMGPTLGSAPVASIMNATT